MKSMNSKGDVKSVKKNKINFDCVNATILEECHKIYTQQNTGLLEIGKSVNLKLQIPRKKITILLIGNHSAGKSSFINWYVEEHIQKTGVAMETKGFSLVTSGLKRETFTGNATLHLYPHMEPLKHMKGVCEYLSTAISTSQAKNFPLITFIDTPGLVDGHMSYPFDVNSTIEWLGEHCEMIFVFFDPIGQALCKRTLDLIEKLSENYSDRLSFFLSKADEAGLDIDRQRVMMQIVQELCRRPILNRHSFDMKTIFIPNQVKNNIKCSNQIDEVAISIKETINQTVQSTLNLLEQDCNSIVDLISKKLHENMECKHFNNTIYMHLFLMLFTITVCLLMVTLDTYIVTFIPFYPEYLTMHIKTLILNLDIYTLCLIILFVLVFIFVIIRFKLSRMKPELGNKSLRIFKENMTYVKDHVINKKQTLYKNYLDQYISEKDF